MGNKMCLSQSSVSYSESCEYDFIARFGWRKLKGVGFSEICEHAVMLRF